MTNKVLWFLSFVIFLNSNLFAQIQIDLLSSGFDNLNDSLFLGLTKTRTIQSLDDSWKAFLVDEPENQTEVSFPVKFTAKKTIIFEKQFSIPSEKIINNFITLNFLGLNYSAEIFLNNATIYKHAGGEIPFSIKLSENILNYDIPNTLRIKIQYDLSSESTIPLLQRFLFPKNFGGIFRDVYLSFRPKYGIKDIIFNMENERHPYRAKLNFNIRLEDFSNIVPDSLFQNYDGRFKIEASVMLSSDTSSIYYNIWNINPVGREDYNTHFYLRVRDIEYWSNKKPVSYVVSIKLTNGDGYCYDEIKKKFTLVDLNKDSKSLKLENKDFLIKGVTYVRSNLESVSNYKQIDHDIKKIKEAGFNTVRFSKAIPHPYAVYLCEKYGLFSLIELPLNSVPENFTDDVNFRNRASSFLSRIITYFNKYSTVIGYGSGGSFIRTSKSHDEFIEAMNKVIKSNSPKRLTYTSFIDCNSGKEITGLDLYGLEVYSQDPILFIQKYSKNTINDSSFYFISEATYPNYKGATNGYLNNFSFEGQAKFFDGIMDVTNESNLKGFILNSMFDFQGDFAPMYSGPNENNDYSIGILSKNDESSRLSYNLIKARLNSGSKTSIPIGSSEEDAPLFFIIAALIISVIIALLINSKRKFREDTTRALLRPYNFYSDIRDQRILTGFHSNILMFLLAGSHALLFTIIFYHLKNSILFDKIVISFGSYKFSNLIAHLAWNPERAFVYLYIATIVMFIGFSIIFHLSSFFVKNRVLFSSIYSVAIWAFLPLALLVPIEAVLYKILQLQIYNPIIYVILLLFVFWNIQRFLKGIYVIFDVRSINVYAISIFIFAIITIGFLFYFQYSANTFDYVSLAFKQFSAM